jgi:D-amino peptidase
MKILIACDMEGLPGVVDWDHVSNKHPEYERYRKIMTASVSAAVRGAFDGGASQVLIADGHANGRNLLLEELDSRAHLNIGPDFPYGMVKGIETGVEAVMYVGYHARAGTINAALCHTWSGNIANVWVNGTLVGEIGLNAAVCGHFGAPVILISGDQSACTEATDSLGPIETAIVKRAYSYFGAECLPLPEAYLLISAAAQRAVTRMKAGDAPHPYRLTSPITLSVELNGVEKADQAQSCLECAAWTVGGWSILPRMPSWLIAPFRRSLRWRAHEAVIGEDRQACARLFSQFAELDLIYVD